MNLYICIGVIILILVTIAIMFNKNIEKFGNPDIYHPHITGYEEGMPNEYIKISSIYPRGVWQHDKYRSLAWDTRFPNQINHRYAYEDEPGIKYDDSGLKEGARLKELPLDLTNRWYAEVDINSIRPKCELGYLE